MTINLLPTHSSRQLARLVFALLAAAVVLLAQQPTPANAYPLWTSSMVAGLGEEEVDGPLDLKFDAAGNPYLAIGNVDPPTDLTRWGLLLAEWDGSAWRTSRAYGRAVCIGYQQTDLSLAVSADGTRAAISFWESCDARIAVVLGTKTPEGTWNWAFTELPYAPDPDSHVGPTYFPSAVAYDGNGFLHLIFGMDFQVYHTWYSPFSGWTTRQEVTDSNHANRFYWLDVSLAIDAGDRLHAAFDYGDNEGHSALTAYAYQNISGDWVNEDVAGAGGHHSLAVDSRGQARIAFHDSRAHSLKYAQRTGVNAWTITTVDASDPGETLGDAGLYPSLALDAADNPHVSYIYDFAPNTTWGTIRYAVHDGAAWQKESVELARNYVWTALALDNAGTPHVTYIANEDVPYATRGDATGEPPPDTFIDSGPARVDNDDTVIFTFHSDDPAATFECLGPSTSFVACTSPHTWPIGAGPHYTFWVRAVSAGQADPSPAFYTFTRDMTPPDSRIVSGPSKPTSDSPDATFTFTANEAATFHCRVRLWRNIPPGYVVPAMQPCTSPTSFTGLDDGSWVFELMATDAYGNAEGYENAASYYWTLDQIGPPTTITGGKPAAVTTSTTATFSFNSSDTSYTFECQFDGGGFAACESPQSYSNLADGSHTFQVRAIDGDGFADPTPAGHTWIVDTTAPDTSLTRTPPNPDTSSEARFTFSSNEAGATFECRLDSAAFAACTAPMAYTGLSDGAHTFQVRATDAAGNVDATPAGYTWSLDGTPPDTSITGQPEALTNSTSATFTFSGDDATSFECRLDGETYAACTSPKSYTGLADSIHEFLVRAKDAEGRYDLSPASYTWIVDTAPETTITTKPSNPSNDPTPDFAFTSSDGDYADGILFHCQTDANGWFPCGGDSITYHNLFDGDHTFRVKAEDTLGNVDPTPATWSWTMDLTPPDTTLTTTPPNPSASQSATFAFSSEDGATFECKLDSAAFAACVSPISYSNLTAGSHTFQARATDAAANVGSPASYTWAIDTTPPDTTITAHPDALTNSASASFSFSSSETGSTFQCALDGATFAACASPRSYTGLSDGSHTFQVKASDGGGLADPTPAVYTWSIDATPPDTTITQWPVTPSVGNTAVFTFSSEAGATFECKLDSGSFAACDSPKNYTGLTDGSHTFQVRAKDAAGNADPSPASYTWTIDTTPPDTSITGKPDATTSSTSATFTFSGVDADSFECKLDSGVYAACTSPQSYNGLAAGSHTFFVRAKDTEGRFDPTPAGYTWTVDANPPETTITGQPAAMTNSTSATFAFTGDGAASFDCKLDSGSFAACTSPKSYTGLAAGNHTFQVRAKDAAGNLDPSPASYTWTIDTTPPTTTIDFTDVLPGSIHFTVRFTEPVNGFANGDVVLSGTAGATTAIVTNLHDRMEFDVDVSGMTGDGTIVLAIAAGAATDAAGNGNTAATLTWTIETPGPDTSLDSYPPNPSNSATAVFTFSGAGALSFECSLDDAPFAACASPHQVTNLADGPHFFAVRAVDDQGKADNDYPIHFWIVDATPPTTTINFTTVLPGSIHFTVHFTEPVNGFANGDVVLSGTAGATTVIVTNLHDRMEFDLDVSGMTGDGTIVLAIAAGAATDAAGNGNTAATFTWTIDTTGPAVTITSAPPDPSDSDAATFTFTSEQGATFECSLDGADFAACASPMNYTGLSDGRHTFSVWATDAAGNTGNPTGHTWTINTTPADTTPPETTIDTWIGDVFTVNTITIEFSSNEPGSTFECQLDSEGWTGCTSPITYDNLADGTHTFQVRATDAAGNTDASPAADDWTVETPGPDTSLDSTPSNPSNSRAATFIFSSGDAAEFECSLDTAPFADCTSPHQVTGLTDGPHLFEVRAVTGQGKVDDTPAGYGWLVDATAPGATINQAAGQADPTTSGPIHFTVLFTEPVNSFTAEDVTVSGTTGATTVLVTNVHDRMEFDVAVSGMTGSCTVFVAVAAGAAGDAAGNANTAAATTDNSVAYEAGPPPALYVTAAGGTANNDTEADVPYTKGDILKWDGAQWTKWFSSVNWGLNPLADLIAFDVIDDDAGSAWLVWRQTLTIRGLGRVMGHDITAFDGHNFTTFFDGSDVGLTAAGERIDGLEVLPGDGQCLHRLLISTVAGGSVRQGTNPTLTFTGEDVLSFCMTSTGMGTVGTWTLLEELQSEGLGRNNSLDIATAGDATDLIYFVPKKAFTLDGATVKPSEIAVFDRTTRLFSGPLWSAKAHGLTQLVDGIDVLGSLPD